MITIRSYIFTFTYVYSDLFLICKPLCLLCGLPRFGVGIIFRCWHFFQTFARYPQLFLQHWMMYCISVTKTLTSESAQKTVSKKIGVNSSQTLFKTCHEPRTVSLEVYINVARYRNRSLVGSLLVY